MFSRLARFGLATLAVAGALSCAADGAAAHTGEFARFDYCPSTTEGVIKCIYSVTNSGSIVLGSKTTPIVNPVVLQGGYGLANSEHFAKFYGATNGDTLSKTPQPVPGGLAGLVPPESSPPLIKSLLALAFENGFTGVNATLELAKPASEIELSNFNLLIEEEVALKLPVKIHLENPFLGEACYVGSNSNPIIWNLTTGTTSPPGPNEPISGKAGFIAVEENEELVKDTENVLVDNAWSAPEASGCGGLLLAPIVDPIIDLSVGLPAASGKNSATLENTIWLASVGSVNSH